jgi:hypothetical protein
MLAPASERATVCDGKGICMSSTGVVSDGPHRRVAGTSAQEQFTAQLFDALWVRYRERVEYVRTYEMLITRCGARFDNDHIAFRTLALQSPHTGIINLSRLFECLGYRAAGVYYFDDKHLFAIHFQHPNRSFPKLFISELQVWRLAAHTRRILERCLADHRPPLETDVLANLCHLEQCSTAQQAELLQQVLAYIEQLPWPPPEKADVLAVNEVSQYGAWVLVHGYNVNHFTSLINSHGVPELDDIEKTVQALREAGVPMKAEIEGARGSILRQSATAAAVVDVTVREGDRLVSMPWTYAYFELAERGYVSDPQTGQPVRFEGFLGAQATHLFEMTRRT